MSFQLKTREQSEINLDTQKKQKIIEQLKNEMESLKAKYILEEKSKNVSDKNFILNNNLNLQMNPKQSEEFSKFLPIKHEKNDLNYNLRNFSDEDSFDKNVDFNSYNRDDNCLEKNDSLIIDENNENLYQNFIPKQNQFSISKHEEENLKNLYPKEFKKENLTLNNINDINTMPEKNNNINTDKLDDRLFSQSLREKDSEYNKINNNKKSNENEKKINNTFKINNNKIIDYDMFDKAKENLLKIRNDLDELDRYDVNKNRRIYEAVGKKQNILDALQKNSPNE